MTLTKAARYALLAGLAMALAACATGPTADSAIAVRSFDHPHPYLAKDAKPTLRPGDRLVLNGPLFDKQGDPVGGYVTEGTDGSLIRKPTVTVTPGDGNFAWRNAVFGQRQDGSFFMTDNAGPNACGYGGPPDTVFAIQNGPALVINGVNLHDPSSRHTASRIGIGATADGRLLVADSQRPVTMYALADALLSHGAVDAIYLDGSNTGWVDNFGSRGDLPDDTTYLHIR